MSDLPQIMPVRRQMEVTTKILRKRLDTVLPLALRAGDIDIWLIICQEDNLDPIYRTMIPMDTWPKILQMLIFFDRGTEEGVERINLSMTDTKDLYDKPWNGGNHTEQWRMLSEIIEERDPRRIGVNIGDVNWAAGGLTQNLFNQLLEALPEKYIKRLTSAETTCTRWAMTLTDEELELYPKISSTARQIIAICFSPSTITPGVTTVEDLEWTFWQMCSDHGLEQSFKPYFRILRSDTEAKKHTHSDGIIRRGDLLVCDVGLKYLGLYTDHQELAYVRYDDEADAPSGLKSLLATNNRLQKIFMREFKQGLSGNQLLDNILSSAHKEGIPFPLIFSHSLGLLVHEPGPLIGLLWEQDPIPGRGEVRLEYNSCFAMELSVKDVVPEWDNQLVSCQTEHIVKFTKDGCQPLDGVQTSFHLI
ncbi:MAG: M24 family metallopeptidase [Candidatus Bathyarchaeota archaeon]|nr:MAG: M24 family metallopeptidase [Candidatus Bathyarchaeota archaeon]